MLQQQPVFSWLFKGGDGTSIKGFEDRGISKNKLLESYFRSKPPEQETEINQKVMESLSQEVVESLSVSPTKSEYDFVEMLFITPNERDGSRMATRVVPGAEWGCSLF